MRAFLELQGLLSSCRGFSLPCLLLLQSTDSGVSAAWTLETLECLLLYQLSHKGSPRILEQ